MSDPKSPPAGSLSSSNTSRLRAEAEGRARPAGDPQSAAEALDAALLATGRGPDWEPANDAEAVKASVDVAHLVAGRDPKAPGRI